MNNWIYFWFMIGIFFVVTAWVGSTVFGLYKEAQNPSEHH